MAQNIIATAERFLEQFTEDHNQGTRYVLTRGIVGDHAAYKGPMDWDKYQVAAMGDKISREHAEKLFGDILTKDVTYRR